MRRSGALLLGMALAAGGLAASAPPAAAGDTGIPVYTWTDADGTTHFSDTPRVKGQARKLVLPTPPPPDRTAIAAQQAWVLRMHREAQADIARAAAERRIEEQRQAETATAQLQTQPREQVEYLPVFFPARHRHWHRRHGGFRTTNLPSARFPSSALPSSFPEEPSFWPPRH